MTIVADAVVMVTIDIVDVAVDVDVEVAVVSTISRSTARSVEIKCLLCRSRKERRGINMHVEVSSKTKRIVEMY